MRVDNQTPFATLAVPAQIRHDKHMLVVVIKATYELSGQAQPVVAEEQIPVQYADEFYSADGTGGVKFESDIAPFKPRADILVVGSAHAPGSKPVAELSAGLQVGALQRSIKVMGDRAWQSDSGMPPKASAPETFTQMPITYDRAFGGVDEIGGAVSELNPLGAGLIAAGTKRLERDVALPNIESLDEPITSWMDHPPPAGFGYYARNWQPRAAHMGTYDDAWASEHAPDPPEDFSSAFYNAAHPDLQLDGYLTGDEEVALSNLTPSGGLVKFALPGMQLAARVVKTEKTLLDDQIETGPEETADLVLNLDTLCLIPDERRFFLIWRGLCDIADMTATEVDRIDVRASGA